MNLIESVKTWPSAKGKRDYLRYLAGERLTQRESILAKCAECCGGYRDGKVDCRVENRPLYPLMPYRRGAADPEGASLPVAGVAGAPPASEDPGALG